MRVLYLLLFFLPVITNAGITYFGHDGVSYQFPNSTNSKLEYILKSGGANSYRARLWVNPVNGYYGLDYNIKLAARMQSAGFKIYIDIHFSDTWADPGDQKLPNGWPSDIRGLLLTVRNYTEYVSSSFTKNGIKVDMFSIGNEIVNGLLWPTGKAPNYENIGMILKQASQGVKAGAPSNNPPKIMVHLPNGADWGAQSYFYDSVLKYNNFTLDDFDMQGVSFYPFYGTSETLKNLTTTLTQMADKYKKEIIISETDWPVACTGGPPLSEPSIPVSVTGQVTWVKGIMDVLSSLPAGLGSGLFYWEPAWLGNANLGSGCSDNLLFSGSSKVGMARNSVNMFNS